MDLGKPFERITMTEAVKKYSGVDFGEIHSDEEAKAVAKAHDIAFEEPSDFDDDDINEDTYRTTFTISEDEEDPEGLEILDSDE